MESAWEGVDRKKAQVVKDPTPPATSNGASAIVESTAEDVEELGAAYASEDEVSRAVWIGLGSALSVLASFISEERIGCSGLGITRDLISFLTFARFQCNLVK